MDDLIAIGNKALYLILMLSAGPVAVATIVGLGVGLFQTVTQLQEQTLPYGAKLLAVCFCLILLAGWFGDTLIAFARQAFALAFAVGV